MTATITFSFAPLAARKVVALPITAIPAVTVADCFKKSRRLMESFIQSSLNDPARKRNDQILRRANARCPISVFVGVENSPEPRYFTYVNNGKQRDSLYQTGSKHFRFMKNIIITLAALALCLSARAGNHTLSTEDGETYTGI